MSIKSNFKGVSRLAMILAAGLLAACGDIQIQGPNPTVAAPALPLEDGDVGTLNASAAFPEGAESLVLSIQDDNCHHILPFPYGEFPYEKVGSGMGLRSIAKPKWSDCEPVHYKGDSVDVIANEGQKQSVHIIHIQRGEEVKPIRLRAGTYTVRAEFFDASKQLLYTGSELFSIINGDSTKVTIRLKKIEAGEVTIDFEIEKPEVLPTKISGDVRLELSLNLMEKYEKKMDLDLVNGTAVISARCIDDRKCKVAVNERKIALSRHSLMTINAIISDVSIKYTQNGDCILPLEYITLVLKSCAECDSKKTHKFVNFCYSQPYHTLSGVEFEKIWSTVNGAVSGSSQLAASK
jgi:hypothetical protein